MPRRRAPSAIAHPAPLRPASNSDRVLREPNSDRCQCHNAIRESQQILASSCRVKQNDKRIHPAPLLCAAPAEPPQTCQRETVLAIQGVCGRTISFALHAARPVASIISRSAAGASSKRSVTVTSAVAPVVVAKERFAPVRWQSISHRR